MLIFTLKDIFGLAIIALGIIGFLLYMGIGIAMIYIGKTKRWLNSLKESLLQKFGKS